MSRTTSDVLVERLIDWGVNVVFGLPGDGINGIMEALRTRQLGETAQLWSRYKPEYERFLRPQPLTEDDERLVGEDSEQVEQPTDTDQTDPASEPVSESEADHRPTETDELIAPEMTGPTAESELERSQEASS